jgi:hypothetical protein
MDRLQLTRARDPNHCLVVVSILGTLPYQVVSTSRATADVARALSYLNSHLGM